MNYVDLELFNKVLSLHYYSGWYMETVKFVPIKMLTLNKKKDNKAEKQEIQLLSRSLCHIKLLCKMSSEGFLYQE